MLKLNYIKKNNFEFGILIILLLISFSNDLYQYSLYTPPRSFQWVISGDEPFHLQITSSIIRHSSFTIDDFFNDSNRDPNLKFPDSFYGGGENGNCRDNHAFLANDGHCYSIHGIGLPLLLIPGYFLGGILGTTLTVSIMFALMGLVIFKFTSNLTTRKTGFIVTLVMSFGTIMFSFSGKIYSDLPAGILLITILYIFFQKKHNFLNIAIVGSLLGFLIFLKTPFLAFQVILLPIMCYVIFKDTVNKKNLFPLIGFFILFLLLFSWYGQISSSSEYGSFGGKNGFSVFERAIEHSDPTSIQKNDVFKGPPNLLFGQSYGIFIFSPILLLSIFGIKFLWKQNKTLTIIFMLILLVIVLMHAVAIPYADTWTTPSRLLLPVFPLMSIPLALLFERYSKNIIFLVIFSVSTLIGISFNLIIAGLNNGHRYFDERADIANRVYFDLLREFPIVEMKNSVSIMNYWENIGPSFWIFVIVFIFIFSIFMIFPIKKNIKNL